MKIRKVGHELFHADRHDEANSRFFAILRTHLKTSQLMQYSEIIALCSQIHTKYINMLCGQNVENFNVQPGGKYTNGWTSKGQCRNFFKICLLKTERLCVCVCVCVCVCAMPDVTVCFFFF